jgi:uncharacterized protein YukE
MTQINVDPALLEQVASDLDNIASDISTEQGRLDSARNDTLSAWRSQFTPLFDEHVISTRNQIGMCTEQIRALARKLRSTAAEVRRVEAEIQRMKQEAAANRRL